MREKAQLGLGVIEQVQYEAELDLVVPFTTPELTRAALDAADRMGAGLNATLRLVQVHVVPFPLDLNQSPVYIDFLKERISQFRTEIPLAGEIRLSRDFEAGLLGALGRESVVILATPKRPWRTRNEHLAATLRRAGHKVVLITQGAKNA
jgi:sugar/nucleoside kinase (ribokinase family)